MKHRHRATILFDVMGYLAGCPSLKAENPLMPETRTVLVDVRPEVSAIAIDLAHTCDSLTCHPVPRVIRQVNPDV